MGKPQDCLVKRNEQISQDLIVGESVQSYTLSASLIFVDQLPQRSPSEWLLSVTGRRRVR